MKYALNGSALYRDTSASTKTFKRPRSPTRLSTAATNFIDLTGDEGDDFEAPPAKRHRSHTPVIKTHQSAKPLKTSTSFGSRPITPDSTNENGLNASPALSAKKKSPFQNIPSWRTKHNAQPDFNQESRSSQSATVSRHGHSSKSKPPQAVSKFPDLTTLAEKSRTGSTSISQEKPPVKEPPKTRDNESSKKVFRMPAAQPLKFNAVSPQPIIVQKATASDIDENSDFSVEQSRNFKVVAPNILKFDPIGQSPAEQSTSSNHNPAQVKRPPSSVERPIQNQPKKTKPVVNIPPVTKNQTWSNDVQINLPVRASPVPPRSHVAIPQPSSQTSASGGFVVNIPPSRQKQIRKEMIEKLKKSTELTKTHPAEVQRVLGLTGFATSRYPTDSDEARLKQAAQPKKRKVNREGVKLDLVKTTKRKNGNDIVSSLDMLTFVHPREQARAILTDRFGEKINPPLTFSNKVNNARLDGKFQFISANIFRKGIKASAYIGQPGCKCTGPCQLDCSCLRKDFDDHISRGVEQIQSYERRPDGITVLTSNYMTNYARRAEISECNSRCGCPPSCSNRVVQKGRTVPLEVFQTSRCGFGVRSSVPMVQGQFIELYLGEVITENELCRREAAQEEGSSSYVYSLDWFPSHSQSTYHIDGHNFGSAMRFVNHSCNPNARTFISLSDGLTKQIYDVGFFAIKDIPPFTEITIDYSPQMEGEVHDVDDEDEDVVQCLCGSENCRRKLWRKGKERKGRKRLLDKGDD